MSDVYDYAGTWCYLCDADHLPCELPDMRYECLTCSIPIEYGEECACEVEDHCVKHCPTIRNDDETSTP